METPTYPSRVTTAQLLEFAQWCEGIFQNIQAARTLSYDEARDLGLTGLERCKNVIGPLQAELEATAPTLGLNDDVAYLKNLYSL